MKDDIKTLMIPESIEIIEKKAFFQCIYLGEIVFQPDSKLSIIGNLAFSETKIAEITIPSSVITICNSAFANCNVLSQVIFEHDSKLSTIGELAFLRTSIRSFTFPSSVKVIGNGAFKFCEALETIIIGKGSIFQKLIKKKKKNIFYIHSKDSSFNRNVFFGCAHEKFNLKFIK